MVEKVEPLFKGAHTALAHQPILWTHDIAKKITTAVKGLDHCFFRVQL